MEKLLKELAEKMKIKMRDVKLAADGKNGSNDSKHPKAKEIKQVVKNIESQIKALEKIEDFSPLWFRNW